MGNIGGFDPTGMFLGGTLIALVIGFVIWLALFLLFRVILLWYWKVNQILRAATDARDELRAIKTLLVQQGQRTAEQAATRPVVTGPPTV